MLQFDSVGEKWQHVDESLLPVEAIAGSRTGHPQEPCCKQLFVPALTLALAQQDLAQHTCQPD